MNTQDLNKYIRNYLEKDRTNRAIMLDGPWGSGKSYYIRNSLVPALKKNEKDRCVVVSLYGLKSLSEISVSIFLEVKLLSAHKIMKSFKRWLADKWCFNFSESKDGDKRKNPTGKIIAKTIVKGIAGYFNVDVGLSDTDLGRLYKTVNLKDKLIVLEDLERSTINIVDVLGYVNNLTEQDGVKALLVTNEESITHEQEIDKYNKELKYRTSIGLDTKEKERKLSEDAQIYLKVKEKTIGDTIKFVCDKEETIRNILSSEFSDKKYFSDIIEDAKTITELCNEMPKDNCNWRSFVYACQKTSDIFDEYERQKKDEPLDFQFKKNVLTSLIRYSLKRDGGKSATQIQNEKKEAKRYHDYEEDELFDFAIDYLEKQEINVERVAIDNRRYIKIEERRKREDEFRMVFGQLQNYYVNDNEETISALSGIEKLLKEGKISIVEYGRLLVYLVCIKHYMDYKQFNDIIDKCLLLMENNIDTMSKEEINLYDSFIWDRGSFTENEELKNKYNGIKEEMIVKIKERQKEKVEINYEAGDKREFFETLDKLADVAYNDQSFLKKLDIEKLFLFIGYCTANDISSLREIFAKVYNVGSNIRYLSGENELLQQLIARVNEMGKDAFQESKKLQLKWFQEDIEKYIKMYQ